MAVQDATTLKSYFNTGDVPTESQFADLIDTIDSKGTGGTTDHGLLTGLADDDHSQYLNETRHDALDHTGLTGVPTQYTDEMAQDAIGTLITNGTQTGITVAYDDANNKIDFTVVASGSGDVTGPSSATDGNIALFDGITGKVIKNSTVSPTSFATALDTDDNYVTNAEKTKLSNLSGTNTGDQDLSGYSTTTHNHSLNNLTEKSYNSLTDKPSIPSISGLLDETAHDALDHTGLTGIPAAYSLPTASTTVLGGVKVDGITVTIADGVISSSGSGMTNPMTASGDIIIGGTSGAPTRLEKGDNGQVLTLESGNPVWAAASGGSATIDWTSSIVVTDTSNLSYGKHYIVAVTAADKTLTLPEITTADYGKMIVVEIAAATTKLITIDGYSTQVIDGALNRVMWASEVAQVVATTAGWTKVGGKSIPLITKLSVRFSGDKLYVANSVSTKILLDTALISTLDSMMDIANARISIRRPGNYDVSAIVSWVASVSTSQHQTQTRIHKNGAYHTAFIGLSTNTTPATAVNTSYTIKMSLVNTDYLELYALHVGATNETLEVYTSALDRTYLTVQENLQW